MDLSNVGSEKTRGNFIYFFKFLTKKGLRGRYKMVQTLQDIGVFLHSFGLEDDLEGAIVTAAGNGFNVVQLGPVADEYLIGRKAKKRAELVDILNREGVKVGPLCFCYEHGGERGGQEKYGSISAIVRSGGYGYNFYGTKPDINRYYLYGSLG